MLRIMLATTYDGKEDVMNNKIDWEKIATQLNLINEHGEHCTHKDAYKALQVIIGEKELTGAVDHYVQGKKGGELSRGVLRIVHSQIAIERCCSIYNDSKDDEEKVKAVELLKFLADKSVLPFIERFLLDKNERIQNWGAEALEQLFYSEEVEESEIESLLNIAKTSNNDHVRNVIGRIISRIETGMR